jgi:paraquat-inducible protein A
MLIACESCDQLHRTVELGRGRHAACVRCGQRLYGNDRDSLELTLALTFAALILLVVCNAFSFMTVSLEGQVQENRIATGIVSLAQSGFLPLAGLILLTTILAPLLEVVLHIWAITPVLLGVRVPGVVTAARASATLSTWSMLEVYLLAVLVAAVKLAMMATVSLDVGAYAFFGLILLLTAARYTLETEALWSGIEATQ